MIWQRNSYSELNLYQGSAPSKKLLSQLLWKVKNIVQNEYLFLPITKMLFPSEEIDIPFGRCFLLSRGVGLKVFLKGRTLDTILIRCMSSSAISSDDLPAVSVLGFSRTSNAPNFSALKVTFKSSFIEALKTNIGVGVFAIICLVASKPSITGMRISIVITFGFNLLVISIHSLPFFAHPMTCISLSLIRVILIISAIVGESSVINTLII